MALQVIGTGFGRTGTGNLKSALEQLGFGPCHHMSEIAKDPGQLALWQRAAAGEAIDWGAVFANFSSSVDWPATRFWRELCAEFPDAKVIHTVCDEQGWIDSVHELIYPVIRDRHQLEKGFTQDRLAMAHDIIVNQTFAGNLEDREHAIAVFRQHNEEVSHTIASERLLVYRVEQGWPSLCEFLGVPVPDAPFPA